MKTILIVEDDEIYQYELNESLSKHYKCIFVEDLESAKLKVPEADLVISDIVLNSTDPKNQDGLILLRWIRQEYPKKPIIIITGYKTADFQIEALNFGAQFMMKPLNMKELRDIIDAEI